MREEECRVVHSLQEIHPRLCSLIPFSDCQPPWNFHMPRLFLSPFSLSPLLLLQAKISLVVSVQTVIIFSTKILLSLRSWVETPFRFSSLVPSVVSWKFPSQQINAVSAPAAKQTGQSSLRGIGEKSTSSVSAWRWLVLDVSAVRESLDWMRRLVLDLMIALTFTQAGYTPRKMS